MNSLEFIIWLRGFTEACNEYHPTPKQWDRIKEVLDEVEDYEDNPGIIDAEIDHYRPGWVYSTSGTIQVSGSGVITVGDSTYNTRVWNDKMCCWDYTNYPEGFGYYTNSTLDKITPEETKKQLLD